MNELMSTYRNPIIFADYSDPDVIRVGDTYYMTASSFNYVPGLPILTSKDLIGWELVNYALKSIPCKDYFIPQHSRGVWAPSIRYHKGSFYIYYGMPDEGIYVVTAKDPLGQWDEPVLVLEGKGLIDPCPYFEEDGSAYIVHAYAKSRVGFNSVLGIFPLSPDGKKATGPDHILFNGIATQKTIEGPKVYKLENKYYILAPAGGVRNGWQTALRSDSLHGPYEEMIVMSQGVSDINGPHQGALISDDSGSYWFLHFQDQGFYGRIVDLEPVHFVDGWPVMGRRREHAELSVPEAAGSVTPAEQITEYTGVPVREWVRPSLPAGSGTRTVLAASDTFNSPELSLQWQWMGNFREDFYSLNENPGKLRLYALNPAAGNRLKTVPAPNPTASPAPLRDKSIPHYPILWEEANVLTQKLIYPHFTAFTELDYSNLSEDSQAGFSMLGGQYIYLAVRKHQGKTELIMGESFDENKLRSEKRTVIKELPPKGSVKLYIELIHKSGGLFFRILYSQANSIPAGVSTDFFPSDHTWTGAKLGLFAMSLTDDTPHGYAEFNCIEVTRM